MKTKITNHIYNLFITYKTEELSQAYYNNRLQSFTFTPPVNPPIILDNSLKPFRDKRVKEVIKMLVDKSFKDCGKVFIFICPRVKTLGFTFFTPEELQQAEDEGFNEYDQDFENVYTLKLP